MSAGRLRTFSVGLSGGWRIPIETFLQGLSPGMSRKVSSALQNHLRTTVAGMGQVETDEIYVGVDRSGSHYVVPVQAKGGTIGSTGYRSNKTSLFAPKSCQLSFAVLSEHNSWAAN